MNSIQDIILESEYNVLMALSEYYEKQIMFETVIMEAGVTTITPERTSPNNGNLIQRFIEWCRKMVDNIKSKTNKVPKRTPVPPPMVKPAETIIQAANEYSDAATNVTFTPERIAQIMEEVNRKVQMTPEQAEAFKQKLSERSAESNSSLTIDNLQEATNRVNQAIDQISNNVQQMENVAGQAQDAVNQNKLKAEKEKLKTGGGILKRLSNLISSMTSSVSSIEGEPISDLKGYTQNIIDTIKNAKSPQDAQKAYDKAVETYDKLTRFYKDKLKNGPVTKQEADYCKSQIQKVQQASNNVTQSYKGNLSQSPKGGIIGDPMPDPAEYFQKATEDIKKAANYDDLSDIWNNVIKEKRAAIDWYKQKSEDSNTSANERKFCKDKMKIVEQWYKGYADTAKQLSDSFVDQMRDNQNGGGGQNTNEPAPEQQQQQNGRRVSPEAQNILNDINGTQNPPQQNPTPEQQSKQAQPQQNQNGGLTSSGAATPITGTQLFDLVKNKLSTSGQYYDWDAQNKQLVPGNNRSRYVADPSTGLVYPFVTAPYQIAAMAFNNNVFNYSGGSFTISDASVITPAQVSNGKITQPGSIQKDGAANNGGGQTDQTRQQTQQTQPQQNPTQTAQPQQQQSQNNPQPTPQQNTQQQNVGTNNAGSITGAQLFDLIKNNLSKTGKRRRWNVGTQLLEFSTNGPLISDSGGNVYPYTTEPYQVRVNTLNPQLFDVVGKGGLDNSTLITPAKFNDHGDLLSKGVIRQGDGSAPAPTGGTQPTQNNPQPTPQQNPIPEQQAQNGQPQPAPQQQQQNNQQQQQPQNNTNNGDTINGEQLVYTVENIAKTANRMQFSPGLSTIKPNQLEMWTSSGHGEGGKKYIIDKDTLLVYPIIEMNNMPMKPALRFNRSPFDINVRVFDIDTPFTPAKVDNLQDKNIIQRGSFG